MDILSEVLTNGKNSRLYKSLVYDKQIAQDVSASQGSLELSGYYFIIATAKPGVGLTELHNAIMAELDNVAKNGVEEREIQRAKNGIRANFIYGLQNIGGFGGKTDQLNAYNIMLGDPGKFNWDLKRYQNVKTTEMKSLVNTYLKKKHIVLSVVPSGKTELQVQH
jgi:zinc protease